jgi:hypothetical protein
MRRLTFLSVLLLACQGPTASSTAKQWPEADALFHKDPQ